MYLIVLCRLIYPGLCIHANVFNHYPRLKNALTTYKAFGHLCSLLQYDVISVISSTNTLRQLLVHPKDPVGKDKVVGPVYKISCEECEATYVGETERSLKARFGEHRRPSSTTSEVSKHIHTDSPDHTIMLENTKILEVEHKWFERGVKEAIHIRALKPSLNRDGGRYNLPPIWNNIIKERLTESAMGTTSGGGAQSEESVSVPGRL